MSTPIVRGTATINISLSWNSSLSINDTGSYSYSKSLQNWVTSTTPSGMEYLDYFYTGIIPSSLVSQINTKLTEIGFSGGGSIWE